MGSINISKRKTKLIKEEATYPDGANSPTIVKTYKCFCKKGFIIEERVVGFNDHFATLECEECEKKYHSFLSFYGDTWVVDEK